MSNQERLFHAAESGDVCALQSIAAEIGPELLCSARRGTEQESLLHTACRAGKTRVVMYLLTLPHIEVMAADAQGQTPAHVAASCGHDGLVIYLVRNGADVHTRLDSEGRSVFSLASTDLRGILAEYDPVRLDIPLMARAFASAASTTAISSPHIPSVLGSGGLPSFMGFGDDSDDEDISGDLESENIIGKDTAAQYDSENGDQSHGEEAQKPTQRSPALPGLPPNISLDQIEELLEFLEKKLRPAAFPKSRVANKSQKRLCDATRANDLEAVRELVEVEGIDIHVHDVEGKNPLHICCENGYADIAQYLLEKGADPNREEEYMNTPLLIASNKGHTGVVEVLLKHGANPKYKGLFGHTAILLASEMGYHNIVELLVKNSADINAQDADGYSALHYAALRRHDEIAIYLIDHGANMWLKNLDGKIPYQLASDNISNYILSRVGELTVGKEDHSYSDILLGGKNHLEISFSELTTESQIGKGSLGSVYTGIYKGEQVALKMLKGEWQSIYSLQLMSNEIFMLSALSHPNILKFYGACTERPHLILVTERIAKGNLSSLIYDQNLRLPKELELSIISGVVRAVAYLHQRNIVHRDLRCANILIHSDWTPKLCDFGMSCQVSDIYVGVEAEQSASVVRKRMHSMYRPSVGALRWMAPEAFSNLRYTPLSDVYSFGMVIFEILASKPPFQDLSPTEAAVMASEGQRPIFPEGVTEDLVNLAIKCWNHDDSARPSMQLIEETLEKTREIPSEVSVSGSLIREEVAPLPSRRINTPLPTFVFTCEDD